MNNTLEVINQNITIEIEQRGHVLEIDGGHSVVEVVSTGQVVVNVGADSAFIHEQLAASASWIFNHPLGRLPAVTLYLLDGEQIETDVFVTSTQVNIVFPTATAGRALLN